MAGDDVYSASSADIWSPASLNSPGRPVEARPIEAPMLNGAPRALLGAARLPRRRMDIASMAPHVPSCCVRSECAIFRRRRLAEL